MTYAELVRHRWWAAQACASSARTACIRISEAGAAVGPWPACRTAMERAARREHARLHAVLDQYEAAYRDAPLEWLNDYELWSRGVRSTPPAW